MQHHPPDDEMRRATDSPQLVCRALVQHDHATKRSTISTARLHTLAINATDLLGDKKTTTFSWIVDLTAPVAQISSGPPPSWNHDYALFSLTSPTRMVNFTCTLDSNPTIDCTRSPSFYQLAGGDHTLAVTAFDEAGNISAPVVWSWSQTTWRRSSPGLGKEAARAR